MSTLRSNFQSRKRAIKTTFISLNEKKLKNKTSEYILLDQLVLDSIVQKMHVNIAKLIALELVNKSFSRSIHFIVYPQFRHLQIDEATDSDNSDEDVDEFSVSMEEVFSIELRRKWNEYRDRIFYEGHEIENFAFIFARFPRISSMTIYASHHWKINEMILRAIELAKCDLPKIERIHLEVTIANTIHITTPALFADTLRNLCISDWDYYDYEDNEGVDEYIGTYTERINLVSLTLKYLPLASPDRLATSFGHMSNCSICI
jgi:hypothetical protein